VVTLAVLDLCSPKTRSGVRSTLPEGEAGVTRLRRSPVLSVAFSLFLAACGGAVSSSSVTHAPLGAALVKGEFVGVAGHLAGIAVPASGRQVIACLCNGDARHLSLAEWFEGPVTSTGIDITNARAAHLVAAVSARAITGTVTLGNGRSAPFTARLLPGPGRVYGLFRSEETFRGVRYLGGWILNPLHFASAGTGPGTGVTVARVTFPVPVCCAPEDRGAGIIDEQAGTLIASPALANIASVTVPGLGTFGLTPCRQAQC
jgi:hypothetical protein